MMGNNARFFFGNFTRRNILVLLEAANLEGQLVGPVGQQIDTKQLHNPLSARIIITKALTDAVFTGDVPGTGKVPPGAVI